MHRSKIVVTLALVCAALAAAQATPAPPAQAQPQPPVVPMGGVNFQGASLVEVINQLALRLHINYILDPSVKGSVTLNTYGDPRNLDARSLLEQILHISGFGMTQVGDVYRIVPLKDISHLPIPPQVSTGPQNIPEDDQLMLNLVFLKYVTADALHTVLQEFIGENARLYVYDPSNLLLILDSRRNMRRTMELIQLFDNDMFANQRVHLFEMKNAKPSDVVPDLENILKSISLDEKKSPVRFLPVDRINLLIAVAPNPGVFSTVEDWIHKLDVPVKISAGSVDTHVYHVRYGRSDCLAMALSTLFGTTGRGGYGGYPVGGGYGGGYGSYPGGGYGGGYNNGYSGGGGYNSGYAGGYGSGFGGSYQNPGGYGNANNFANGFGGTNACGGLGYSGGGASYGYPAFGGYTAQTPVATNGTGQIVAAAASGNPVAAGAATPAAAENMPRPPRIVPNPLDNALIIQADAQQYQSILKVLEELDVPPRQILLEAKIYEVDLQDQWQYGINYSLGPRTSTQLQAPNLLTAAGTATLTVGALVSNGRELLATLTATENASKVHTMSEPSLIATDSIPATITVGTQVPVSTGSTAIPTSGGVSVSNGISSENVGITFEVNARVNPSGIVTLVVNQEISSIDQAATQQANLGTPAFSQQVVQTQITMQDGDTIAIGGTIQDNVTNSVVGVPGLDRLPFIGGLFGQKTRSHTRSEMIIFMTPHIILNEQNLIEASDELKSRLRDLRRTVKDM